MSGIRIQYVLSPTWNHDPPRLDTADEMTLRYDCFLGDVTLKIGGLDASAAWGWVPLLDFALALKTISDRLAASGHDQVFEFTESDASIKFQKENDNVVIDPSYVAGSAEVPLAELISASTDFLASLLQDLIDRHSQLASNEFVATLWKPGSPLGAS